MQIVWGGCRGAGLHVSRGTGVQGYIGKEGQPSADSNIKVAGFRRRPMATDVGHQVARTAAESESVKVVESES